MTAEAAYRQEQGYNEPMKPIRDQALLDRMERMFDLCDAAEDLMRQNIRRRHPEFSDAEVEQRIAAWYLDRPIELDEHVAGPYQRLGSLL